MHPQAVATTIPLKAVPSRMAGPQCADGAVPARFPTNCSSCGLRELCLPCGMSGADLDRIDQLIYTRRRIKRKSQSTSRPLNPNSSLTMW